MTVINVHHVLVAITVDHTNGPTTVINIVIIPLDLIVVRLRNVEDITLHLTTIISLILSSVSLIMDSSIMVFLAVMRCLKKPQDFRLLV